MFFLTTKLRKTIETIKSSEAKERVGKKEISDQPLF